MKLSFKKTQLGILKICGGVSFNRAKMASCALVPGAFQGVIFLWSCKNDDDGD
jgi:hypothetical protein